MRLPQTGELFEGKYQIRQALGEGGFATVFHATDTEIEREVAIKVLAPRDGEYPGGIVARFMREARVIAGLQDPHTIKLFEFGESADGLLYMVFQYVSGIDLAELLRRRGPLSPAVAIHIARQVLFALNEAHAAGVLHRDIKPANVLVHSYMGDEFTVKLLDFGIAKVESGVGGPSITKTGAIVGTPRYMAPEQIFGEELAPPCDIYSLGLVMYEMLVGRPAVVGSKDEMLRAQVSDQPFILPYDVAWPSLRQVVERMLARPPNARFQSAREVIGALDYAQQDPSGLPSSGVTPWSSGNGHALAPISTEPRAPSAVSATRPAAMTRQSRTILSVGLSLCVAVAAAVYALSRPDRAEDSSVATPQEIPTALLEAPPAPYRPPPPMNDVEVDASMAPDVGVELARAIEPKSDGCGKSYTWSKAKPLLVSTGTARRQAHAFLPIRYDPNKRYPVVVVLQPRFGQVHHYATRTQLRAMAYDEGKVIVLGLEPSDMMAPWNDPDDIELLRHLVPTAAENFCLDRSRVYAVGTGAGGQMARELACALPLSGIATSGDSEHLDSTSCAANPPVPMLAIFGRDDRFVPMKGGVGCTGIEFLSADDHDEIWRARNGCGAQPTKWLDEDGSFCNVWTCDEAPYGSCRAAGGHYLHKSRWEVMDPASCASSTLKLSAGRTAWKFFQAHGRVLDVHEPPAGN